MLDVQWPVLKFSAMDVGYYMYAPNEFFTCHIFQYCVNYPISHFSVSCKEWIHHHLQALNFLPVHTSLCLHTVLLTH